MYDIKYKLIDFFILRYEAQNNISGEKIITIKLLRFWNLSRFFKNSWLIEILKTKNLWRFKIQELSSLSKISDIESYSM